MRSCPQGPQRGSFARRRRTQQCSEPNAGHYRHEKRLNYLIIMEICCRPLTRQVK